jgi:hypothetical protein
MTFAKHYLLALLVFNLAACSNLQVVSIENAIRNPPPQGVDYGSLVYVKMLDGSSSNFRVTVMNADGLGGNEEFYRYENMGSLKVQSLERKDSQAWPIILGILGAAALVYLFANADSVSVCSPAPCQNPQR